MVLELNSLFGICFMHMCINRKPAIRDSGNQVCMHEVKYLEKYLNTNTLKYQIQDSNTYTKDVF